MILQNATGGEKSAASVKVGGGGVEWLRVGRQGIRNVYFLITGLIRAIAQLSGLSLWLFTVGRV